MDEQEDHYSGETDEKGEPHGRGSMHYAKGGWLESYEGEWRNGKRHGHGKFSDTEFRLEGEWRDGQIHGFGIKTYFTGEKFSGEFRDGTEYKGSMVFVDGEIYDGEWSNGRPGGRGVIVYEDFARYEGGVYSSGDDGWRHRQEYWPHGEGEMRYPDGEIYSGKWHSGIPLDLYEGELLDGLPHGQGTLSTPDDDRYEGQWKGGLPHGKGTLTLGTITLDVEMENGATIRLIDHNGPGEVPIELKDNQEIVDYVDRIRTQLEHP